MAQGSENNKSFMAGYIPVKVWRMYLLRFTLFLMIPPTVGAMFELPKSMIVRVIVDGMLLALTMSAILGFRERLTTNDKRPTTES